MNTDSAAAAGNPYGSTARTLSIRNESTEGPTVSDSVETELRRLLSESSLKVHEVVGSRELAGQPSGLRAALREAVHRRQAAEHRLDRHLRQRHATAGAR